MDLGVFCCYQISSHPPKSSANLKLLSSGIPSTISPITFIKPPSRRGLKSRLLVHHLSYLSSDSHKIYTCDIPQNSCLWLLHWLLLHLSISDTHSHGSFLDLASTSPIFQFTHSCTAWQVWVFLVSSITPSGLSFRPPRTNDSMIQHWNSHITNPLKSFL